MMLMIAPDNKITTEKDRQVLRETMRDCSEYIAEHAGRVDIDVRAGETGRVQYITIKAEMEELP